MPRKRYKPEEIVAKLRQVDVRVSQGASIRASGSPASSPLAGSAASYCRKEVSSSMIILTQGSHRLGFSSVY